MNRPRTFLSALLLAAGSLSLVASAAIAQDSPNYGTTNLSWVQVAGAAFIPVVSPSGYGTTTGPVLRIAGGVGGSSCTSRPPSRFRLEHC